MSLDKEGLRNLLGQEGDVNKELSDLFGSAYLDHPDDTHDSPKEFKVLEDYGFVNVTGIVKRGLESAQVVDCQTAQQILLDHLKSYIEDLPETMTMEDSFSVSKHIWSCWGKCDELDRIAKMDKYLTPEEMEKDYGKLIKNWRFE